VDRAVRDSKKIRKLGERHAQTWRFSFMGYTIFTNWRIKPKGAVSKKGTLSRFMLITHNRNQN
jgi:hypothetical protein